MFSASGDNNMGIYSKFAWANTSNTTPAPVATGKCLLFGMPEALIKRTLAQGVLKILFLSKVGNLHNSVIFSVING